jgi:general secretion pathway protein J
LLAGSVQASGQAQALVGASGDLARLRALLTADAGQAAPRPWRDREGRPHAAFAVNDGALFTLVRRGWANPSQAPRASLQRVEWVIQGDTLVRRSAAMVDGPAATQASVLAKGITAARLRVLMEDLAKEPVFRLALHQDAEFRALLLEIAESGYASVGEAPVKTRTASESTT